MESFMAFDARFFIQNFLELSFCFVGAISCSVSVCLCFYVRNINGLCFASSHNSVSTLAWCEWLHFFWIWLLKNYIFLRWWMKNMCLTCKWVFPERLLFMVVWSDTGAGGAVAVKGWCTLFGLVGRCADSIREWHLHTIQWHCTTKL